MRSHERTSDRIGLPEIGRERAAGLLSEIFALDLTVAQATCDGCGSVDSVGALHLYAHEMGAVLRCPSCERVVMCVVRTPTQLWLDASGSRSIAVPIPAHWMA